MGAETNESVLRKTQLFARLTEGEMRTLCARVGKRHFGRGEALFSDGDQCRGLFIVATGRIRIFKLSPSGREQVLTVEGPGSSFAELPVFDGGVYPASASALEDAEVLFISRHDFQNYCREHPEVALRNLSRLQAEGLLEVDGRTIIIKDLPGLKREQIASEYAEIFSSMYMSKTMFFSLARWRWKPLPHKESDRTNG